MCGGFISKINNKPRYMLCVCARTHGGRHSRAVAGEPRVWGQEGSLLAHPEVLWPTPPSQANRSLLVRQEAAAVETSSDHSRHTQLMGAKGS